MKKEGVRSNVRAGMKNSFRASVGPPGGDAGSPGGDAGSSEMEIRANTATIRPTNSGNRRKAEEAPARPHLRNLRLVFARYRALPRRDMETGAEKVEALLNRPRMTTNRGAGFVSWRGKLWRPNELGFQRMTRSLWPRLASFSQQGGIESLHRCLMV